MGCQDSSGISRHGFSGCSVQVHASSKSGQEALGRPMWQVGNTPCLRTTSLPRPRQGYRREPLAAAESARLAGTSAGGKGSTRGREPSEARESLQVPSLTKKSIAPKPGLRSDGEPAKTRRRAVPAKRRAPRSRRVCERGAMDADALAGHATQRIPDQLTGTPPSALVGCSWGKQSARFHGRRKLK